MTLKPLYTIRDLCEMTGLSRVQVLRLIRKHEIELVRVERRIYVPLSQLRDRLRHVWDSLELSESMIRNDP